MPAKMISLRPGDRLLTAVMAEIERYNAGPLNTPVSLSEWIQRAMMEKLAHSARSRKRRKKPRNRIPAAPVAQVATADPLMSEIVAGYAEPI